MTEGAYVYYKQNINLLLDYIYALAPSVATRQLPPGESLSQSRTSFELKKQVENHLPFKFLKAVKIV